MAVNDLFKSTSFDVYTNTSFDIWYGAEVEEIDPINLDYAVRVFYLTLTGTPDGTTDIEIPMSSFQGRRRNGNPTYLSAVIHDITYADEISARPNGEIYVEMAYVLNGVETEREEIIRTNLDTVVVDEGSKSQAITLSGNKTESWIPKLITLTGANYKRDTNDAFTYRFADVNVFLHPGDTVTSGDDTFIPSVVNMTISATQNGINASMEITE